MQVAAPLRAVGGRVGGERWFTYTTGDLAAGVSVIP